MLGHLIHIPSRKLQLVFADLLVSFFIFIIIGYAHIFPKSVVYILSPAFFIIPLLLVFYLFDLYNLSANPLSRNFIVRFAGAFLIASIMTVLIVLVVLGTGIFKDIWFICCASSP